MTVKRKDPPESSRSSERLQVAKAVKLSEEDVRIADQTKQPSLNLTQTTIGAGTKNPKRFRRPRQSTKCMLLNLPGEIRNEIYRYALVESDAIKITPKGPGEPPLLRICKSIRTDTRSIYFAENKFLLQMTDFNGADFVPWGRLYRDLEHLVRTDELEESNVQFNFGGKPDWENLVKWTKADRFDAPMRPNMEPCYSSEDHVLAAAFKIVDAMRYLPWDTVEKALRAMRFALNGSMSTWAEKP